MMDGGVACEGPSHTAADLLVPWRGREGLGAAAFWRDCGGGVRIEWIDELRIDSTTESDAAVRLCCHGVTTARASASSCSRPLRYSRSTARRIVCRASTLLPGVPAQVAVGKGRGMGKGVSERGVVRAGAGR